MAAPQLGPWAAGMNLRASDASLASDEARLLINFDVDDAGRLRARESATELVASTITHSLEAHAGKLFYVSRGTLYRLTPPAASPQLVAVVGLSPMSWAKHNGELFGSNGEALVRLDAEGNLVPWGMPDFVDANGILLTAPQPAPIVASWGAFILTASGKAVRWTEPFTPDLTDPLRNAAWFDAGVVGVAPCGHGVWVMFRNKSVFLTGKTPAEWVQARVVDVGSISRGYLVDPARPDKVLWVSTGGWVEAGGDGTLLAPQSPRVGLDSEELVALGLVERDGATKYVGVLSGATLTAASNTTAVTAALKTERK